MKLVKSRAAALLGVLVCGLAAAVPSEMRAQNAQIDPRDVEACLAGTLTGAVDPPCLGAASNACQRLTPDGGTTIGITACTLAETGAWDDLLNREYGATRDAFAGVEGLTDQLLAAQRAWIAYRDAECALAYARWQDGSMRGIVGANCVMVMTARRTVELRDMRGE